MKEALAKFAELRRSGMPYNEALEQSGYGELLKCNPEEKELEDIKVEIEVEEEEQEDDSYNELLTEITLSEFTEDKEYELITTAKQTDHRYGDFEYTKSDLETMANNFNSNIVGTEIPVDLNHDPEHIAYAWIKPGSMSVKESSTLSGQYSLYAQLYKFTPEGLDMVTTGKVRYFSLQIQNVFTKFVDKTKKTFNLVIRALALTNMPVIKDMAPTLSESILLPNHINDMKTLEELQAQNAQILSEKEVTEKSLSEKEVEIKRLSDELAKVNAEKREVNLSEQVEKLCLSEDKTIGFKGGEKAKILEFVKTLSDEQANAYFALHTNILTGVDLGEHGDAEVGEVADETASKAIDEKTKELASKEGISYGKALEKVLSENPELASKAY